LLLSLVGFSLSGFAIDAGGLSPQEALKHMRVADGFEVKLAASEPEIRQPLSISFDERGRMWVIQYLQYPTPAGLKPVSVDQYLRTKYDHVPEPPPSGPKGADRITICEDTDGDGRFDTFKDFVTGLNLASGMAIGYGGVFVLQAPYLLFYPGRNHDDVPDSDPEVLLSGFGLEDAHAVANSLTWGPDGWLYGAQGSTVTAHIRGIEFQQGIWRYHPRTHEFELFAEGGGNTWGLDFDEHGNVIAGTNFGEQIALHQVQGGYYIKGFSKHGPLHNPYTFGYFDHIPYRGFKGGHVTDGGIVYQGGAFPSRFNGAYIAGNLLANAIYWHVLERNGSGFKGHFGGPLLETDDITFRPVDCETGPDGSLFIADWCDRRATHVDPLDTWDRSNGRIYKLLANGTRPVAPFDLLKTPSPKLIEMLSHPNDWFVRAARRLLAERRDAATFPTLRENIFNTKDDHLALESLWALYASGGFTDDLVGRLIKHRSEDVRAWTIRLLGDAKNVSPAVEKHLIAVARSEPSPVVRNQLACSARRLPGGDALPIIRELLHHDEDARDPEIPLLIWWAIEGKAISNRGQLVALFSEPAAWKYELVRQHIIERLARRYAAEGADGDFETCARLLSLAPTAQDEDRALAGMELALAGRRLETVPPPLESWFSKTWGQGAPRLAVLRLGLRIGDKRATSEALRLITDNDSKDKDRASLIEALGEIGADESAPALLALLQQAKSPIVQTAVVSALRHFPQSVVAQRLLAVYPSMAAGLRQQARAALCSRASWAAQLLDAVDAGSVDAKDITLDQVRQMASFKDTALAGRIEKRWGRVDTASDEEKQNTINRLRLVLNPSGAAGRSGKGDSHAGKQIFQQTCGVCHRLFGDGNDIGPDLTGADRKNSESLLLNIVNPSAYIRPEFVSYEVTTKDGQSITGLMVESSTSSVTIRDRNNQQHVLSRAQISELKESAVSLMPDGLLEALTPQQVMDLFAYVQSDRK
jgi:putative membrane-bound dehydrogenase-like protein